MSDKNLLEVKYEQVFTEIMHSLFAMSEVQEIVKYLLALPEFEQEKFANKLFGITLNFIQNTNSKGA